MLHGHAALPLGGCLAPVTGPRDPTGQTGTREALAVVITHRVGAGVGLVEKARALGKRCVIEVEHGANLGVGRQLLAQHEVCLGNLGGAVLPEPVDLEPADAGHELRGGVPAIHADLLPVVAVAAELDVRRDRQPTRRVERSVQVDHPAGRVAVEHRARAADDVDPADRPQVDVARLRRAVRRRDRNAVLDDRQPAQTEPRLRRADAEADAPREAIVPTVLDEQTRNPSQRLIERRPALRELDLVALHDGDRLRYVGEVLVGARDRHRFGERRDGQHQVRGRGAATTDRH